MKFYCRVKDRDVKVDIKTEACLEADEPGCIGCSRNRKQLRIKYSSLNLEELGLDLDWTLYTIEENLLWFSAQISLRVEPFKLKDEMDFFYMKGKWFAQRDEVKAKGIGVV